MDSRQPSLQSLLPKPSTVRTKIPASYATNLAGAVAEGATKKPSGSSSAPWNPTQFQLWVEHGVVWDLKQNQILGFVDYPSILQYFAPTVFKPNTYIFVGSPYSLTDFPVYGFMGVYYTALIFSALPMLSHLANAWGLFRAQGLTNGATTPPATACPAATTKEMGSFLAETPSGTKTFSAKYVAYMWKIHPTLQPWWPPS
jgi:hypothetical protein